MSTRRSFLKGAAATGIAFRSCGILDKARAQPKPPRLPVKVGGKRVLTIDVHSHCYFHEALNLMGDAADKVLPPVKGVPEHFIVMEQRLKEMDAMAIDMEILSITARTVILRLRSSRCRTRSWPSCAHPGRNGSGRSPR